MQQPRLSPDLKIYSTRQKPSGRRAKSSPMQLVALRLNDLGRLFRQRYGPTLPDDDAGRDDLRVALNHLACLPHPQRRIELWVKLWAPWLTIAELDEIAAPILLRPKRWKADALAWELGLTKEEREMLAITTIGAMGQTKADRAKRRKQLARQRMANYRRRKGVKPRKQYEEQSISRQKPWIAEGISRATWYRRKRETTLPAETTPNTP